MLETTTNLKSFSVLVSDTGASQLSFCVISEINNLPAICPNIDGIVFYENKHKNCLPANFSVMHISSAWGMSGPVIATSFSTAYKLLNFPSSKKFFYVWNLEWITGNDIKQYERYKKVYQDTSLSLIARSEPHKKIIENAFNRDVEHVVSDFNMSEILEIIK
ncbi:MAG TPA: hypothetical protein DHV30_10260 [Balneola sp.]|nr:hypothetical protein [Balneola sp.]|tara:strand:- start:27 stop:512 length:486 start_codon:yes stop_codon:yes gene_type:complete